MIPKAFCLQNFYPKGRYALFFSISMIIKQNFNFIFAFINIS